MISKVVFFSFTCLLCNIVIANCFITLDLPGSCSGRCNSVDDGSSTKHKPLLGQYTDRVRKPGVCSCAIDCMTSGNCCSDYFEACWNNKIPSCVGRCDNKLTNLSSPCQCGEFCTAKDNCCPDYYTECLPHKVTDEEIQDMAESLLFWDRNTLTEAITVNLQGLTDNNCENRNAYEPLLQFNSSIKNVTNTYMMLGLLYDDYTPDVTQNETLGTHELQDVNNFLNAVSESQVLMGVRNFLDDKGFVNHNKFYSKMLEIWFTFYKRSKVSADLGSSGFEHVFLGEYANNEASGFHNWFRFLIESDSKAIQYNGYLEDLQLNDKARIVNINFKWLNKCKKSSSMFVGTSPEFEMAIYTLCWFTRPDSLCPVILGGHSLSIQTYQMTDSVGRRFVTAAYPVLIGNGAEIQSHNIVAVIVLSFSTIYFNLV